jgi:hypothetical protein
MHKPVLIRAPTHNPKPTINPMKTTAFISIAMLAAASANAQAFIAYNDLASTPANTGSNAANVTTYGGGVSTSASAGSGLLLDFTTGLSTGVTLTLTKPNSSGAFPFEDGNANVAFSGGDAFSIFSPGGSTIVDTRGTVNFNGGSVNASLVMTFTGLSPSMTYSVVVAGNRGNNTTRNTLYTLSGVDAYQNTSSLGATFSGLTDLTTSFNTGTNTANGYVARWTGIDAGADGSFVVTASAGPGGAFWYANAVQLIGTPSAIPEPASASALLGLGAVAFAGLRRRRSAR